jgi:hypothetical protein
MPVATAGTARPRGRRSFSYGGRLRRSYDEALAWRI